MGSWVVDGVDLYRSQPDWAFSTTPPAALVRVNGEKETITHFPSE